MKALEASTAHSPGLAPEEQTLEQERWSIDYQIRFTTFWLLEFLLTQTRRYHQPDFFRDTLITLEAARRDQRNDWLSD